jgi:adenylate kinase family enzyme
MYRYYDVSRVCRRAGRILIVGSYGSGKTTLGKRLSGELNIPHYEMDSLFWGPHWTEVSLESFRGQVAEIALRDSWIVEGHFTKIRDLVLPRSEAILWIDVPLRVAATRLLKRTAFHWLAKDKLWNGNQETLGRLCGREAVLWRLYKDYGNRREEFRRLENDPETGSRVKRVPVSL